VSKKNKSQSNQIAQSIRSLYVITWCVAIGGVAHLWSVPTREMGSYLLTFLSLYVVLAIAFFGFIVTLPGKKKVISAIGLVLSLLIAGYDLFGIALGAIQF